MPMEPPIIPKARAFRESSVEDMAHWVEELRHPLPPPPSADVMTLLFCINLMLTPS
uniref:Uncharacterized protein n=1 Tax=Ustilago esculenta TaxID=185366 RepID=A0A481SGN4_9BASI|nr:hypothetical protein UE_1345 [Ustilago esculenta]